MELSLVLDTNAYSDWRQNGRWHVIIRTADRIRLPSVVLGELFHGFRRGRKGPENLRKLDAFLAEPQVLVQPIGRRTAEIYGEFLEVLRRKATPIPTNDIWIAACVQETNSLLATRDEHFEHLPEIRLVDEGERA